MGKITPQKRSKIIQRNNNNQTRRRWKPDSLDAISHLFRRPRVQIDGFHLGDVDAQVSVDAGAADAKEDAEVPRRPSRALRVAVHAIFVVLVT